MLYNINDDYSDRLILSLLHILIVLTEIVMYVVNFVRTQTSVSILQHVAEFSIVLDNTIMGWVRKITAGECASKTNQHLRKVMVEHMWLGCRFLVQIHA